MRRRVSNADDAMNAARKMARTTLLLLLLVMMQGKRRTKKSSPPFNPFRLEETLSKTKNTGDQITRLSTWAAPTPGRGSS
jgi:hypothetical protein